MTVAEFFVLLGGLLPETPLGRTIAVRQTKDGDTIRRFSPHERQLYDQWHKKGQRLATDGDLAALEEMFATYFN